MAISYDEFLVLCTLNYLYPDCKHPSEDVAWTTVVETEGDPRGNISLENATQAYNDCIAKGWIQIIVEKDEESVSLTILGEQTFQANLEYWTQQIPKKLT